MMNARRAARELALKVLFQVEIGKQPLAEVMDGAIEQIQQTVDHPVSQLRHELQAALKSRVEERRTDLSTQSLRHVRNVARSAQAELDGLLGEISRRTRLMLSSPAEHASEDVSKLVKRDADQSRERIQRLHGRESLQPELVRAMVEEAIGKTEQAPVVFARVSPQAHGTAEFLHKLVNGVLEKQEEIDSKVAALSAGWALDRQPAVDRNILRIAAYEILFLDDVPAGASINEAVELAKKFSTAESGRFVNGVLGTLAQSVGRERASVTDLTADGNVAGGDAA